jgi:hypothetical protein
MDKVRDSNHTVRLLFTKTSRLFRDNAKPDMITCFHAAVDSTNAFVRFIFGLGIVLFTVLTDVCEQGQKYWTREVRSAEKND